MNTSTIPPADVAPWRLLAAGLVLATTVAVSGAASTDSDPFLQRVYDARHDSPMQQHFRQIAPMPFGVVFLPWAGMTEADARAHFRLMRELGFNSLKQTMPTPEWPTERTLHLALEEGIIPFWYGEGGWEPITPELLKKLGLPADLPIAEARKDSRMIAYQREVIRRRIGRPHQAGALLEHEAMAATGLPSWAASELRLTADPVLRPDAIPAFKLWLRERYPSIEALSDAWNQREVGIVARPYQSWGELDADAAFSGHNVRREYRFTRDVLRFKADYQLARLRARLATRAATDPHEPQRAGGEMGLFLPFGYRGTDMAGVADSLTSFGSFYPSIHLAWHFHEVEGEVARPIYMQTSIAADWFKGGWSAAWESTGGPQQFSGGEDGDERFGFTVDDGAITQLLLSHLAAGFRGVGLWAWNYRRAGWEAGEYALLDRQHEPSPRARRAGAIAHAANRYRDELWAARKEPLVGVFVDWENEAYWAAVGQPNRDAWRHYPIKARIGVSRALIDANVPWEYVTRADLAAGLGPRYRVLYLPAQLAIAGETWPWLKRFVEGGGRLVIDAPGGWYDDFGRVLETGKGSAFAEIFGTSIADFQFSNNRPRQLGGERLDGFVLELKPTTAKVTERFADGTPAATENKLGRGSAVVLAWDASFALHRPGNRVLADHLRKHVVAGLESPYACDGALVYRLAAPEADHYFLINDGDARRVRLQTRFAYRSATDALTGESIPLDHEIALEAHGGRWLRLEKAPAAGGKPTP